MDVSKLFLSDRVIGLDENLLLNKQKRQQELSIKYKAMLPRDLCLILQCQP